MSPGVRPSAQGYGPAFPHTFCQIALEEDAHISGDEDAEFKDVQLVSEIKAWPPC